MTALGAQMAAEMRQQPAVLQRLVAQATSLSQAIREVTPSPLAGATFLARGSSDNAAMLGRYLAELFGRRPAGLAAPSLYTRYGAHVDHRGYLLVAVSQSGATPEIVSTCAAIGQAGAAAVAVTNEPGSPLADVADVVLLTNAGPEQAVPATKTVTAHMLLMQVVARSLHREPGDVTSLDRRGRAAARGCTRADDKTCAGASPRPAVPRC